MNTAQFDKELKDITQRRGENYGHPAVDFARAASLKALVQDCEDPRLRHVLEMLCVKIARLTQTPTHFDSWLDIAGYARTACMVLDYKEKTDAHKEERFAEVRKDLDLKLAEIRKDLVSKDRS